MAKSLLKLVRFVGLADSTLAQQAAAAFEQANSGLLRLPWTALAGDFLPDCHAAVFIGPMVPELPNWSGLPVHWTNLDDLPTRMNRLMSFLVTGVELPDPPPAPPPPQPKRVLQAKVGRETAGRKGKGVTTVFDLTIPEDEIPPLAQLLKTKCGSGGTVKDGKIEIQGDHRDKIMAELEKLGYKTKRVGG